MCMETNVEILPNFGLYTFVLCMRLFSDIGLNRIALKTKGRRIAMKTKANRMIAPSIQYVTSVQSPKFDFVHLL
jgi:hypothetical protein